jgi:putative permease
MMNSLQKQRLKRERQIKLVVVLGILVVGLLIISLVENMLVSFLLAFVSAYLLAPIVNWLERSGLPRTIAILIPFLGFASILSVGIYLILPIVTDQLGTLQSEIPKYIDGTKNLLADFQMRFKGYLPASGFDLGARAEAILIERTQMLFSDLPNLVSRFFTVCLLAPFFAYFMLQDGRNMSRMVLSLVPNNLFEVAVSLQHQINKQMGDFIRARLLEAVIVGLVTWIGLYLISFPYSPLLAAFAAVTNLIPYVGPLIGAVPPILIAIVNDASSWDLFLLISVYLVAQIIDAAIIIPLVVAKIVNLHPVTVVIVIILGAQLMGVLGMIISIPVASVLKLVSSTVYRQITDPRST